LPASIVNKTVFRRIQQLLGILVLIIVLLITQKGFVQVMRDIPTILRNF